MWKLLDQRYRARQIESTRAALEKEYGIAAAYSAADMSKPG
jgi:hypothetical protein